MYYWREYLKKVTTPNQRHKLIVLRERLVSKYVGITSSKRSLPNAIIIGAPRCGTTHLFNSLRYHPNVHPSRIKEIHFFDREEKYVRGENYYRSFFPYQMMVRQGDVVIEATPGYFLDPKVPDRIASIVPDVKLILLLRNPVERAISRYFYSLGKVKNREVAFRTIEEFFLGDKNIIQSPVLTGGVYVNYLRRFDPYYTSGKLKVVKSEDYFTDKNSCSKDLCSYLNIASDFRFPDFTSKNESIRNQEVPESVKDFLSEFYASPNEQLYEYLGVDLNW